MNITKNRKDIVKNYNATYLQVLETKLILINKLTEICKEQNKLMHWLTYKKPDGSQTKRLEHIDIFEGPRQYEKLGDEIYCLDLWARFGDLCTDKNGKLIQVYQIQLINDPKELKALIESELNSQLSIL